MRTARSLLSRASPLAELCSCYSLFAATCLGFQLVNFLVAGGNISVVTNGFDSENITLPLDLATGANASRMLTAAGARAFIVVI